MLLVNTLLSKIAWCPMNGIVESRKVLSYFSLLFSSGHLEYLKVPRFRSLMSYRIICKTKCSVICFSKWNCVSSSRFLHYSSLEECKHLSTSLVPIYMELLQLLQSTDTTSHLYCMKYQSQFPGHTSTVHEAWLLSETCLAQ